MYIAVCIVGAIRNLAVLIKGVIIIMDDIAVLPCCGDKLVTCQELLHRIFRVTEVPVQLAVFICAHKGIVCKCFMGVLYPSHIRAGLKQPDIQAAVQNSDQHPFACIAFLPGALDIYHVIAIGMVWLAFYHIGILHWLRTFIYMLHIGALYMIHFLNFI